MKKTILITGGMGFIGSNFIRYFLKTHPDCLLINIDKLTYSANPENLRDDRNEPVRLEEALSLNRPLATAYYMKEDLRLLWSFPNKASAEVHLQDWIARAEASGIRILKDVAKTLSTHRAGILAYYDHRISSGPLEGTNNKIKTNRFMSVKPPAADGPGRLARRD